MAAFYLTYRPQNLEELIGQDHIKENILNAFTQNKLSHAYLFVGPRGTGKTSTARILAKMVNCEKQSSDKNKKSLTADSEATPKAGEAILKADSLPCNKCSTCLSITDGSNLDLIEIDAASNRGIEDIRSLREKIKLAPTLSKKKVYIIDEVHMLTTEAFNALLKTLEEPPAHVMFILATTEVAKVPQTILSRVQRLDFKLATQSELLQALRKIVLKEKINIDEEALKILIKRSDGCFRDGIKLLDQISSMEGKITVDSLGEFLMSTNFDKLWEFLQAFIKKDTSLGLTLVLKEVSEGADTKNVILSIMDILRSLIFIKNGLGENLVKANYLEENYQDLVKASDFFSNQDLVRNLDICQKAYQNLKTTSIPSLPLELAVVEICGENSKLKTQNSKLEEHIEEKLEVRSEKLEKNLTSNLQPQYPSSNFQHLSSSNDIQKLKEKWTFVLETVRPYNFSLEALLRSINIKECTDVAIYLEVPYTFHQRILEAPKNRDLLESILSDILGRTIKVTTVLGVRTSKKEDIANIEVAADDEIIRAAAEIFNSDSVN